MILAQITLTIKQLLENNVEIFEDYPIFDESYRPVLEKHIVDRYYLDEIGQENVWQFKHYLNARLRLIMPKYNKYFMAMNLEQRILDNYDIKEEYTRDIDNTGDVNSNSTFNTDSVSNNTSRNIRKYSESPQSRVNLDDNQFLTNLNDDTITSNSTAEGIDTNVATTNTTNDTHEHWVRTMQGNIGVQTDADAINKYISSLINVDEMILEDIRDLFMMIY